MLDWLQGWGRISRGPLSLYNRVPRCYLLLSVPTMEALAGGTKGSIPFQQRQSLNVSFFSNSFEAQEIANQTLGFQSVLDLCDVIICKKKCVFQAINDVVMNPGQFEICCVGCTNCRALVNNNTVINMQRLRLIINRIC